MNQNYLLSSKLFGQPTPRLQDDAKPTMPNKATNTQIFFQEFMVLSNFFMKQYFYYLFRK